MIRIINVEISNFRSFKEVKNTMSNLSAINVMVGKNNVGKTNLLRAVFLFFHPDTYDYDTDRNYIKKITGGGTVDAKISLTFSDDETIVNQKTKYKITCDFNKPITERYKLKAEQIEIEKKLDDSNKIKKFLGKKFKCVFLSTTDEDIDAQSKHLVSDLILRFYQKQNKDVKKSIEMFESSYQALKTTFKDNIAEIESKLKEQFETVDSIPVKPKLELNLSKRITSFLLENIRLKLDDSYAQDISSKGAGIQRASLILLTIYLLSEIYKQVNKIILLDEPEAFLYPLLEKQMKKKLEESVFIDNKMQVLMTSHSRTYLSEINNTNYKFAYLTQLKEEKEYKRSKNQKDINKYTCIDEMTRKFKYEVLKNYGLLDEIDDYEYVIVCEGQTDCNYIRKILAGKDFIPQIRYGKYSSGNDGIYEDLDYNYIGKGASSCLPILIYLDKISDVPRKVFVLLDGDNEGEKNKKTIKSNNFRNLELEVVVLPKNKVIEDIVFEKSYFAKRVINTTPSMIPYKESYLKVINSIGDDKSVIEQTKLFINGNNIVDENNKEVSISKIKCTISQNLDNVNVKSDWLLDKLEKFFYSE